MTDVITALALAGVLVVGLLLGLIWRGVVFIGDRQSLDRLSAGIEAEQRMRAATQAAMAASRRVVREHHMPGGGR